MFLNDQDLAEWIFKAKVPILSVSQDRIMIWGQIRESQVQPASVDVRLGGDFIEALSGEEFHAGGTGLLTVDLAPGECILATLVESITVPPNMLARIEGKSSWARRFLTVHSAGFIDPGFNGDLTLELKNDGPRVIKLTPGDPIAQISFAYLSASAIRPYGSPGLGSHYQGQKGPTEAR